MRRLVTFLAAVLVTVALAFGADAPQASKSILLHPQRVFDASSAAAHEGWVVLVTGEKIAGVGPAGSIAVPPGTTTIDLPGMTLLPGLIDAHSHIFLHPTTRRCGTIRSSMSRSRIERSRRRFTAATR